MLFNIQNPRTGGQKKIDIEEDHKVRAVLEKSLGDQIDGAALGFPGYIFKITGGSDKEGFPMKQGVRVNSRVKLLLTRGSLGYRAHWGRSGMRKRKTVRGCIVGNDIRVLQLIVLHTPEEKASDLEALEAGVPRTLLPKRASTVRRLLHLSAGADVRKEMPKHKSVLKSGKHKGKAHFSRVKVQRLITPVVRRRRDKKVVVKRARQERSATLRREYQHKVDRLAKLSVQRTAAKRLRVQRAQGASK